MDPLTLEQINEGRRKILANVSELLDEATLLLDHGYVARAHALAQLGAEECAKLPMLIRAAACLVNGKPFDWNALDKRFRDHKAKIHLLHFQESMNHPLLPTSTNWDLAASRRHDAAAVNRRKNHAFYVTFLEDHFQAPSECISRDLAVEHLALARRRFRRFEFFETAIGEDLTRVLADPQFVADFEELLREATTPTLESHAGLVEPWSEASGPDTLKIAGMGLCWYSRSDYQVVRSLMEDAHVFAADYESWLRGALAHVETLRSRSVNVVKVLIDSEMFPGWCKARAMPMNAKSRTYFAAEVAREVFEGRILRGRGFQKNDTD